MRSVLALLGGAVLLMTDMAGAAPAYAQYYGPNGYYGGGNPYYGQPQGYGRPYRRRLMCVTQYRSCAAGPSFQFPGQYCECRLYNYGPTVPGVTQ